MTASQRERAEAVFGHVQHAVTDLIHAAHDALEILEEAVTSAGLAPLLARLDEVGQTIRKSPPPPSTSDSRVERIPVR